MRWWREVHLRGFSSSRAQKSHFFTQMSLVLIICTTWEPTQPELFTWLQQQQQTRHQKMQLKNCEHIFRMTQFNHSDVNLLLRLLTKEACGAKPGVLLLLEKPEFCCSRAMLPVAAIWCSLLWTLVLRIPGVTCLTAAARCPSGWFGKLLALIGFDPVTVLKTFSSG